MTMSARRPLTAFAEQVRSLRAGLSLAADRPRIIAVTAARPAEGKSVLGAVARPIGAARAASGCWHGVRRAAAGVSGTGWPGTAPGLLDVLRGEVDWRECDPGRSATGMHVHRGAASRRRPARPCSCRRRCAGCWPKSRDDYDLILLDAPPVEAMTEARIVAALADATLLCVRWRFDARRDGLLHTLELLQDAHANVIGTVLTRVDPRVHLRSGSCRRGGLSPPLQGVFPGVADEDGSFSGHRRRRICRQPSGGGPAGPGRRRSPCWTTCGPATARPVPSGGQAGRRPTWRMRAAIDAVLADGPWDAVFHFASLSQVGESMRMPMRYLLDNAANGIRLIDACVRHGVGRFVLSSTAALFNAGSDAPIPEDAPIDPQSAYGDSKWMIERALRWAGRGAWAALRLPALLQCGRRRSGGAAGRGPSSGVASDSAGDRCGAGPAGRAGCVRRRLSDSGRHLHPRLRACLGPGDSAHLLAVDGAGPGPGGLEPGQRRRAFGAGR